jgi:hypothetical protein
MEKITENKYPLVIQESEDKKIKLPGYPSYPPDEDIYVQNKEEIEVNPEVISEVKGEKTGNSLDVPGSELDDQLEETGNEDEENNYYSLGGDDHDQ